MVSKIAFAQATAEWLGKCGMRLEHDYDILGNASLLANDWVISFRGADGVAARRSALCLKKLKIARGVWEEFWAYTPLETWAQDFIGGDKSPKQVATEVATKRLGAIIEASVQPEAGAVSLARREGVVMVALTPLALVLPQADSATCFRWNDVLAGQLKLQKDRIIAQFEEQTASAGMTSGRNVQARVDAVEWCS